MKWIVDASGKQAAQYRIVMAEGRRPDGQPMCGFLPKASLLCGTQVTRVRINGGALLAKVLINLFIYTLFLYWAPPHERTYGRTYKFGTTDECTCKFGSTYKHSYKFWITYERTYNRSYVRFFPREPTSSFPLMQLSSYVVELLI